MKTSDSYKIFTQIKVLTPKRCQKLIKMAEDAGWADYKLDEDAVGNAVHQYIWDLDVIEDIELHSYMWNEMEEVNEEAWLFNLTGWQQPLRVAKYLPGFAHDWHVDYTTEDQSKLAFSIPLNHSSEYRGGELQLLEAERIEQKVGYATVFPAFHGHRVTPVTAGTRYVLLGWLTGPRFR